MPKDREEKFDPNQPALIVRAGNAVKKHRRLDRDVFILGRAGGCDVGLDAPDVAPVHCVLVRAIDGWHVRDCTGKGGTRVNGQSVRDAALADEDVLQVGSFSFQLHLPPDHRPLRDAGEIPEGEALRRSQRSRHNLARLALRMRAKAAEATSASGEPADQQSAARQEELDKLAEELGALQRDLNARDAELKEKEKRLAEKKLALQEKRGQYQAVLTAKKAETDAAIKASLEECKARCRAMEEEHAKALAEKERVHQATLEESSRQLEIRARETASFAGHLRGLRQRLNEHEESLTARWEEWLREQQEASLAHAVQSEKIAREGALLRDQRAEIVRLMGEMRQLRKHSEAPAETLRAENEQLRQDLTACREQAARHAAELEELRAQLEARPGEAAVPVDVLQRFHVELDTGRRILDDQFREVQGRFAELERAARQADTHLAHERARIAQEQQELERLRGEEWAANGHSPHGETIADTPSPLDRLPDPDSAEAPVAPSHASAVAR